MICLRPLSNTGLKYDHIVGTGGIGSGIFFSMSGSHTLGRNESRMAKLLPYKDFCKQHIIMHYVSVLMGAKINGNFRSFPIGKVGDDDIGKNLISQMKAVGMNTEHIGVSAQDSTLFSVCYQYPDHSGGNITTENSASNKVSPEDVSDFFKAFKQTGDKEIVLAVPEVPLDTRLKLLRHGRERGSFTIASILSSEVDAVMQAKAFDLVDLLAINIDEARSIAKITDESAETKVIVDACISSLAASNPSVSILITDGAKGVFCYTNKELIFTPALKVPVNSTAGAGDAFLAGTIAGLCCGLPMAKINDEKNLASPLQTAVELGVLLASLSVTSNDTIHPVADAEALYRFGKKNDLIFGTDFIKIFQNCAE